MEYEGVGSISFMNPKKAMIAIAINKNGVRTNPKIAMIWLLLTARKKITRHMTRLVSPRDRFGINNWRAAWATVKQRAKTPKGPINAKARNVKINVPV